MQWDNHLGDLPSPPPSSRYQATPRTTIIAPARSPARSPASFRQTIERE
eukprot:CAMPEP_0198216524 /NCGR_PEP_ID=MMETSP1445-20131203/58089_1 /TAXON_ID=36898 /ORGANISM="Pyramimonas sp., Strain CCMP2087" /LENGTH=48 /DNA_ID= /DNA_START= /DNA_END= /DNA_ORIENTATION=